MARRITIRDVAREAGVSPATVSYVCNGKQSISEETKLRVQEAIKKLDYVPNMSARSLSSNDSLLIGVLVPQTEPGKLLMFENTFYSELLSNIEYEARIHGYHLLISGTDADESYLNLAKERNLDGIIAIGVYPDDFYAQLMQSGTPFVLVDSYCGDCHCHNVRIDDSYGSYLATKYVLDKGHRNIAFFCGQLRENGVMKKRFEGYSQALHEYAIPFREDYLFEGKIDFDSGVALAQQLVTKKTEVSAIVAAADILAIGAMKALYEADISVPSQLSVIGFDDLQIARYSTPGLTTIHQQISQKGKRAVELLVQNIREPGLTKREEILPIHLVERGSVGILKEAKHAELK